MITEEHVCKLIDRAKEQKIEFVEAAEISREVYAGELTALRLPGNPIGSWHFYRTACQNLLARVTASDPRPQVRAKNPDEVELASMFQEKLDSLLDESSITPSLRSALQDTIQYGNGFLYVNPDGSVKHIDYFQCYADNAKSTTSSLGAGRYFFVQHYMDLEDFKARFPEIPEEEIEHLTGEIPGRSTVGTRVEDAGYAQSQTTTSLVTVNGNILRSARQVADGFRDGLTAVWECFVTDPESPSGWSSFFLYKDKIISEPVFLPEHFDGPPVVAFSFDSVSGQFYQPSLWVYLQDNQNAANFIKNKALRAVNLNDFRGLIVNKTAFGDARKSYKFVPGEVLEVQGSPRDAVEFFPEATVPDQYFKLDQIIKDEARENAGIFEESQGSNENNSSGTALQILNQQTNIRTSLLMTSITEGLKDLARLMVLNIMGSDETIDLTSIAHNFSFEYLITPPITKEQKTEHMLAWVDKLLPATSDIVLAIKLAGNISGNPEIADEFLRTIEEYQQQQPTIEPEMPVQPDPYEEQQTPFRPADEFERLVTEGQIEQNRFV